MKTPASPGGIGRPQYPVAVLRAAVSRLELAVSAALALTVVSFTLGSSSVSELTQLGLRLRWLCLFALVPLSLLLLRGRSRPITVPARAIYVTAGALVLFALDSAFWSVRPTLTLGRATSLLILVFVAASLGLAAAGRPALAGTLVRGLVAGAAFVAASGVVLLLVDRQLAIQHSSPGTPARFRGLGQNPNTASLLSAVVLPLAVWQLLEARTTRARVLFGVMVVVLCGTIVGSGSYGALGASFVGVLVLVAALDWPRQRRAALAAVALAGFVGGIGFDRAPGLTPPLPVAAPVVTTPGGTTQTQTGPTTTLPGGGKRGSKGKPTKSHPKPKPPPVLPTPAPAYPGSSRLEDEIGSPSSGPGVTRRTLFGGSGRGLAWQGALDIGLRRPLAGYGFGTEERVFVDRWYFFNGSRPENSVLGIFLQLGIVGVVLLTALAVGIVLAALRAIRQSRGSSRRLAAGCAGAVAAASLLALVQSFIYSVGNIGSVPLWVLLFLVAALSAPIVAGNDA